MVPLALLDIRDRGHVLLDIPVAIHAHDPDLIHLVEVVVEVAVMAVEVPVLLGEEVTADLQCRTEDDTLVAETPRRARIVSVFSD